MVHTLPDYTSKWKNKTISNIVDNAELAARLGSISTHDRSGDVIWMDDFEGVVCKWIETVFAADAGIALSTEESLKGDQSLKMNAGFNVANYVYATRYLANPVTGNLGFENAVTYDAEIDYLLWEMRFVAAAATWEAKIKWRNTQNDLQYLNAANVYVTFATDVDLATHSHCFNAFKMVVDTTNLTYARFIFNHITYPMTAYGLHVGAGAAGCPYMFVSFRNDGNSTKDATVYMDNVIVTQNEDV